MSSAAQPTDRPVDDGGDDAAVLRTSPVTVPTSTTSAALAPSSSSSSDAVRVAVRIRPMLERERLESSDRCIHAVGDSLPPTQVMLGTDKGFTFDAVLSHHTQAQSFDLLVRPLLDAVWEGFNATIFAYGQTGSGKTYTMGTGNLHQFSQDPDAVGIVPRVIANVFDTLDARASDTPGFSYTVKVTFLELYGDTLKDLLNPAMRSSLAIREDDHGDVVVVGARDLVVTSSSETMRHLEEGSLARATGSTMMNTHSSRSHAIFTLLITQRIPMQSGGDGGDAGDEPDGGGAGAGGAGGASGASSGWESRTAKFHFVDLAGSERAKRTKATGKRFREGVSINQGLLALGNVISALGDDKKRGRVHVPYRDSKLTRMLQDSLGGNTKTVMVACVSPASSSFEETLTTLRYANRARNIKNKPVANRDLNAVQMTALRREVEALRAALQNAAVGSGPSSSLHSRGAGSSAVTPAALREIADALGLSAEPTFDQIVQRGRRLNDAASQVDVLRSQMSDLDTSLLKAKAKNARWSKRFSREEEKSVEAQAKAAFLEHRLRLMGVDPFPDAGRQQSGDAPGAETAGATAGAALSDDASAADVMSVIKRQVRRIQQLEAELEEQQAATQEALTAAGVHSSPTKSAGRLSSGGHARRGRGRGAGAAAGAGAGSNAVRDDRDYHDDDGNDGDADDSDDDDDESPASAAQFEQIINRLSGGRTVLPPHPVPQPADVVLSPDDRPLPTTRLTGLSDVGAGAGAGAGPAAGAGAGDDDGDGHRDHGADGDDESEEQLLELLGTPADAEARVKEAEREFETRQMAMARSVKDYKRTIVMKESLLQALQTKESELGTMRNFYEDRVRAMAEQLDTLRAQRDAIAQSIEEVEHTQEEEKKRVKEQLMQRLREKDKDLAALKARQRDLEKVSRMQSRTNAKIRELKQDLVRMKKRQAKQQHLMDQEKARFKSVVDARNREIHELQRRQQRDQRKLTQLQDEGRKRDELLKRKTAAVMTANRKLRAFRSRPPRPPQGDTEQAVAAVAAATRRASTRRKQSAKTVTPVVKKMKRKLDAAVKRNVAQEQRLEQLQTRLDARERDLQMLQELIAERDRLLQRGDVDHHRADPSSLVNPSTGCDGVGGFPAAPASDGSGAVSTFVSDALVDDINSYFNVAPDQPLVAADTDGGAGAATPPPPFNPSSNGVAATAFDGARGGGGGGGGGGAQGGGGGGGGGDGTIADAAATAAAARVAPPLPPIQTPPPRATAPSIRSLLITPRATTTSAALTPTSVGAVRAGATPVRPMTTEEVEALEELEERIEAFQARLEFGALKILEVADDDRDRDDPDDDDDHDHAGTEEDRDGGGLDDDDSAPRHTVYSDGDDEDETIRRVSSLPEAQTLLKLLFRMVVQLKKDDRHKDTEVQKLQADLASLQTATVEQERAMVAQRLEWEREVSRIEAEHDDATKWLVEMTTHLSESGHTQDLADHALTSPAEVARLLVVQSERVSQLKADIEGLTGRNAKLTQERDTLRDEVNRTRTRLLQTQERLHRRATKRASAPSMPSFTGGRVRKSALRNPPSIGSAHGPRAPSPVKEVTTLSPSSGPDSTDGGSPASGAVTTVGGAPVAPHFLPASVSPPNRRLHVVGMRYNKNGTESDDGGGGGGSTGSLVGPVQGLGSSVSVPSLPPARIRRPPSPVRDQTSTDLDGSQSARAAWGSPNASGGGGRGSRGGGGGVVVGGQGSPPLHTHRRARSTSEERRRPSSSRKDRRPTSSRQSTYVQDGTGLYRRSEVRPPRKPHRRPRTGSGDGGGGAGVDSRRPARKQPGRRSTPRGSSRGSGNPREVKTVGSSDTSRSPRTARRPMTAQSQDHPLPSRHQGVSSPAGRPATAHPAPRSARGSRSPLMAPSEWGVRGVGLEHRPLADTTSPPLPDLIHAMDGPFDLPEARHLHFQEEVARVEKKPRAVVEDETSGGGGGDGRRPRSRRTTTVDPSHTRPPIKVKINLTPPTSPRSLSVGTGPRP